MPDNNSNSETEITSWGKFFAGFLLIAFTFIAIYHVVGYWPDKMPTLKDGDDGAWYTNKIFNITLIEKTDTIKNYTNGKVLDSVEKQITQLRDSIKIKESIEDSLIVISLIDSLIKLEKSAVELKGLTLKLNENTAILETDSRIHLNIILLFLVALMGFLGNMIHIASSFTAFVGNGTFKRSWILWYCVKPFTAAGLAIIVYLIIRAGFFSYGTGAAGINLYGILALSAFAGLFTDSATLKFKELFEVIFKPKDERDDKLVGPRISVTSISPLTIPQTGESTIILKGTNLDTPGIKITMDGNDINSKLIAKDSIEIKYSPTPAAIAAAKTVLVLIDVYGKSKVSRDILIKP
jgi:hypothetical protein